jgi:hypothetical protein
MKNLRDFGMKKGLNGLNHLDAVLKRFTDFPLLQRLSLTRDHRHRPLFRT